MPKSCSHTREKRKFLGWCHEYAVLFGISQSYDNSWDLVTVSGWRKVVQNDSPFCFYFLELKMRSWINYWNSQWKILIIFTSSICYVSELSDLILAVSWRNLLEWRATLVRNLQSTVPYRIFRWRLLIHKSLSLTIKSKAPDYTINLHGLWSAYWVDSMFFRQSDACVTSFRRVKGAVQYPHSRYTLGPRKTLTVQRWLHALKTFLLFKLDHIII